tara:strand:- start:52 stop:273 length:222 start_codon:yes stop_codon:yes gene_type:complete
MKLSFTKLIIEYDSEAHGRRILDLLDSINIVKFQASIEAPSTKGYFCIGGTDPSTLTDAISSIIDHKKEIEGE